MLVWFLLMLTFGCSLTEASPLSFIEPNSDQCTENQCVVGKVLDPCRTIPNIKNNFMKEFLLKMILLLEMTRTSGSVPGKAGFDPHFRKSIALLPVIGMMADLKLKDAEKNEVAVSSSSDYDKEGNQDCAWNKDYDFPRNPPLLIDKNSWLSLKPVREGYARMVRVAFRTAIVVACSGNYIWNLNREVAEGICIGLKLIQIAGQNYTIHDLACNSEVHSSTLANQGSCGWQDTFTTSIIGFRVRGYPDHNSFYGIITVCFEHNYLTALYSKNTIYGVNVNANDALPYRAYFIDVDNTYGHPEDPHRCYRINSQFDYFKWTLNYRHFIDTRCETEKYFSRGHLAPKGDFANAMEAIATYFYINAVPQWQAYNNGNWGKLETDTRNLAYNYNYNLEIYNGPVDFLLFGEHIIYLCASFHKPIIPIPRFMWKVIYEPSSRQGVAIIISNDAPRTKNWRSPTRELLSNRFCARSVCDRIHWLTFNPENREQGYVYCCTVEDFKDANPGLLDIQVSELLTG